MDNEVAEDKGWETLIEPVARHPFVTYYHAIPSVSWLEAISGSLRDFGNAAIIYAFVPIVFLVGLICGGIGGGGSIIPMAFFWIMLIFFAFVRMVFTFSGLGKIVERPMRVVDLQTGSPRAVSDYVSWGDLLQRLPRIGKGLIVFLAVTLVISIPATIILSLLNTGSFIYIFATSIALFISVFIGLFGFYVETLLPFIYLRKVLHRFQYSILRSFLLIWMILGGVNIVMQFGMIVFAVFIFRSFSNFGGPGPAGDTVLPTIGAILTMLCLLVMFLTWVWLIVMLVMLKVTSKDVRSFASKMKLVRRELREAGYMWRLK